jgi:hypothetical protein
MTHITGTLRNPRRLSHIRTPNPYMARTLFPLLTSAPQKRLVVVGKGNFPKLVSISALSCDGRHESFA